VIRSDPMSSEPRDTNVPGSGAGKAAGPGNTSSGTSAGGAPEPPEGLVEQRNAFVQTFFKKGAELTEELLREEARLRDRMLRLEAENAQLRAQVASDDAIRDLLSRIDQLERDKRELLSRIGSSTGDIERFSRRFAEIEEENARLASLYVASFQLHSTLELSGVVRHLRELLAQLVGAEAYALYVPDTDGTLVPVVSEGVPPKDLPHVHAGVGPIGEAFADGHSQWTEGDPRAGTLEAPAACVPLRAADRSAGVIVILRTFEQKASFVDVDFELFKLLGVLGGAALAAARLFARHGLEIASVDAFRDLP